MTVPVPRLGPYTGTTPVLNNLTPFTYRDGYTFLELIEELRDYVSEQVTGEINAFIKLLNEANEGLAEKFNRLAADTKLELDRIVGIYEGKFQDVDRKVDDAVRRFSEVYENYRRTLDEQIAALKGEWGEHKAEIRRLTDTWREMVGPPTTTFQVLTHNVTGVTLSDDFSNNHPRDFIFQQSEYGYNRPSLFSNTTTIEGRAEVRKEPYSVSRVRLVPSGYGTYLVDPSIRAIENSIFYKKRTIRGVSYNRYSAFPSAVGLNDCIFAGWAEYENHTGGANSKTVFARSVDDGLSWATVPGPNMGSATKPGLAAMCNVVNNANESLVLLMANDPLRGFLAKWNDSTKTWNTPIGVSWGGQSWEFPTEVFQSRDRLSGTVYTYIVSYGGAGVKLRRKSGDPFSGSWEAPVTVADGSTSKWPYSECTITESVAGHLVMAIRYEDGDDHAIYLSRSTDHGRTWSRPTRAIRDAGGHPKIIRLSNGIYLMALRNHDSQYPSESWCYAISQDAYSWRKVPMNGGMWCMYGEFVESPGGTVVLVGADQIRGNANRSNVWAMQMDLVLSEQEGYDSGWYPLTKWRGPDTFTNVQCRRVGDMVTFRGEITLGRDNSAYGTSDNVVAQVPEFARPSMRAAMSVPISGSSTGKATQFWVGADGKITLWPTDANASNGQVINLGGMSYGLGKADVN